MTRTYVSLIDVARGASLSLRCTAHMSAFGLVDPISGFSWVCKDDLIRNPNSSDELAAGRCLMSSGRQCRVVGSNPRISSPEANC